MSKKKKQSNTGPDPFTDDELYTAWRELCGGKSVILDADECEQVGAALLELYLLRQSAGRMAKKALAGKGDK